MILFLYLIVVNIWLIRYVIRNFKKNTKFWYRTINKYVYIVIITKNNKNKKLEDKIYLVLYLLLVIDIRNL